jgi:galactose mutarotase-like enzyme
MSEQSRPWVGIRSNTLTAEIDPLGAQLSTLKDGTRDLLWDGEPALWAGRSPMLFPIVGALAGGSYRWGAQSYSLSRHGFARGKPFSIIDTTSSSALFRLRADDATLKVYPFRFELDVQFAIAGATLSVTTTVRNQGNADMPASVGYHPGLRWPLPYDQPRSSHFIEFEFAEPEPVRRIGTDGLLTPHPEATPVAGRRLALVDSLFQNDVLIFDRIKSRSVTYGGESGPRIRVRFPDAPYLGVWTKPGAPFICIEPWHGITDPQGFTGDFADKPGIFILAAGECLSTTMEITLEAARD